LTTPVGIDWHGTCERGEVREKLGSRSRKSIFVVRAR